MIYRPITVDCTKDNMLREKLTGYEHGVVAFEITPVNKKQLIDLTDCRLAVYYGTKSDGHTIKNTCIIKDNKVYLPVSLQMTTCFGYLNGSLELQYDEGNVRFYGVNFEVFPSPETAEIESTDESTLLEKVILKPEVSGTVGQVLTLNEDGTTSWTTVSGGSSSATNGKSAYEIAVDNGFEGSEAEWLESLKGERGTDGINGIDGQNGTDGIGITSTEINASGELVLTYSDGSTANVGVVVGAKGDKGDDEPELINTITLTEDVAMIELGNDNTDFVVYKELYIIATMQGASTNTTQSYYIIYKNEDIAYVENKFMDCATSTFKIQTPKTATRRENWHIKINEKLKGFEISRGYIETSGYQATEKTNGMFYASEGYGSVVRDKVVFPQKLILTTQAPTQWNFGAGTTIEIYGVRK